MKKTIKLAVLVLAVFVLCAAITSCAQTLSGTYSNGADVKLVSGSVSYTFTGKKVTIKATVGIIGFEKEMTYEGKYEIGTFDDGSGKITFTFETNSDDGVSEYSGEHRFSQNKDAGTITIDGLTYKKE
ncbi:MAG: hypothetical protein MJ101_02380 [Clostridia bacterium]|nr:hypothetical protein [Clostridia bacterium]